jgi:hypothetical protein
MAFEIELIKCLCCDAGDIVRIDHREGPVGDHEHIADMSGCLDEVKPLPGLTPAPTSLHINFPMSRSRPYRALVPYYI